MAEEKKTRIVYVSHKRSIGGLLLLVVLLVAWMGGGAWVRSHLLAKWRADAALCEMAHKHPLIARLVAPERAVQAADRFHLAYSDMESSNVLTAPVHIVNAVSAHRDLEGALVGPAMSEPEPPPVLSPPSAREARLAAWQGPQELSAPPNLASRIGIFDPHDWIELWRIEAHVSEADFAGNNDYGMGGDAPDLSLFVQRREVWLTQDKFSADVKPERPLRFRAKAEGFDVVLGDRDVLGTETLFRISGLRAVAGEVRSPKGSRIRLHWRHCSPAKGAKLITIMPNTPASRIDMQIGDVIVGWGDTPIDRYAQINDAKAAAGSAVRIPVRLWRDGRYFTVHVPPGQVGFVCENWRG
jgi:hypothetical protein